MLAKHIPKDPVIKDSYRALAEYLAAASDEGEKLEHFWITNCNAGKDLDSLDMAIMEVEATQALNARAGPSRAYHLMVSFGTAEQPTEKALQEMEQAFAQALGFEEHQRVCAAHGNTDNFHFHVAYNRIHPTTFHAHTPWNDYKKLESVCRRMEKEYGLKVDLGMSDYEDYDGRQQDNGRKYESMSWEQSFQNYVLEHKDALIEAGRTATDWQDLHRRFAAYDLLLKPRGNGFVIMNTAEDHHDESIKASVVHRSLSKGALEKRLGAYQRPLEADKSPKKESYNKRPITRHSAQSALWQRYLGQRKLMGAPSLMARLYKTWKLFLYGEALNDPLAMVIIMAHKQFFDMLTPQKSSARARFIPKTINPAWQYWKQAATWAKTPHTKAWFKDEAVRAYGVKMDAEENLLIPLRDAGGQLQAVQVTTKDGESTIIGNKDAGIMHLIDPAGTLHRDYDQNHDRSDPTTTPLIVTSDYAMAAKIHHATGLPTAAALYGDNVRDVAKALQRTHKHRKVIIADTQEKLERMGNTGKIPIVSVSKNIRASFVHILDDKAFTLWEKADTWATPKNAPWLQGVGVRGFGIKLSRGGHVLIPLKNAHGRLEAVEVIDTNGKAIRWGHCKQPVFHTIDPGRKMGEGTLIIATGYEEAARIHQATRAPVIMAPTAEALEATIKAVRGRYKEHTLLIAESADARMNDTGPDGTEAPPSIEKAPPSIEAIAKSVRGRVIPMPTAKEGQKAPQFMDIRRTFAHALGDDAFLLWERAGFVKNAPGLGLKQHPDNEHEWLLPFYDKGRRLCAVQVLDSSLNVIGNMGEENTALSHVMGQKKGKEHLPNIQCVGDYATALKYHRETKQPVMIQPKQPDTKKQQQLAVA